MRVRRRWQRKIPAGEKNGIEDRLKKKERERAMEAGSGKLNIYR